MSAERTKKDCVRQHFSLLIIHCSLIITGCASYGAGGVYSYNDQSEMGGYVFVNLKYAEATISYAGSLSDNDTQSLGMGFSFKYPFHVWKGELFPLVNIEYQRVFGGTEETVRNLGWVRVGVGLDYTINDAFYVRGEALYAPDMFSSLPKNDAIGLNPTAGYTIRFGLGWKPGVAITSKRKEKPAKTDRDETNQPQTNQAKTNQPQTSQTQTNQPQINVYTHPDTARDAYYLSDLEKDIILEMNLVRSDPRKYAEMYINPNLGEYARECYEELRNAESIPVLLPKKGLSQAAKDHVADTGPKGVVGHDGADGSSMSGRISRYGTWNISASENISYGYNTAREIVLQLLIDDGVESRGHRRNIMNKSSRYVGVAAGAHSEYRYMCVQDFAGEYTDR